MTNEPMSVVLCLPEDTTPFDPQPDETTKRDVRLVSQWESDTAAVVGWSSGGWDALELAAAHPDLPRLAIVSLPFPLEQPSSLNPDDVKAKTLLLYGSKDPQTGSSHGTKWQKRLPVARLEMVPGGEHDLLVQMWPRILSHLAPRRTRK